MSKTLIRTLSAASVAGIIVLGNGGMALAGSKTLPSNSGLERAAANASQAGINLFNTIISDAGVGNGNEVAVGSITSVVSDPYDVTTTTYGDTTTSTNSTTETVPGETTTTSDGWVLQPGNGNNTQAYVYKRKVTVTETGDIITTTEVTSETPYESVGDTFEDTTTTTAFEELDPGKSQAHNKAPEEGAPEDLIEISTADIGDVYDAGTITDTEIFETVESYETVLSTTNEVCNQGAGNTCPDTLDGYN